MAAPDVQMRRIAPASSQAGLCHSGTIPSMSATRVRPPVCRSSADLERSKSVAGFGSTCTPQSSPTNLYRAISPTSTSASADALWVPASMRTSCRASTPVRTTALRRISTPCVGRTTVPSPSKMPAPSTRKGAQTSRDWSPAATSSTRFSSSTAGSTSVNSLSRSSTPVTVRTASLRDCTPDGARASAEPATAASPSPTFRAPTPNGIRSPSGARQSSVARADVVMVSPPTVTRSFTPDGSQSASHGVLRQCSIGRSSALIASQANASRSSTPDRAWSSTPYRMQPPPAIVASSEVASLSAQGLSPQAASPASARSATSSKAALQVMSSTAQRAHGLAKVCNSPRVSPRPPLAPAQLKAVLALPKPECNPKTMVQGIDVDIGVYRFRCSEALGKGSFGEVWSGEILSGGASEDAQLEVALKDIICNDKASVDQACFEAAILSDLSSSNISMPRCLAHREDKQPDGSTRIRMAMTRVPGQPLESVLANHRPSLGGQQAVRRGFALASELIKQLGKTLDHIGGRVLHRDVNPRNVLVSNAVGGDFDLARDSAEDVRFWLIDFGLAVETKTWPSVWSTSAICGDCRYWPGSAYLMSFYGASTLRKHQDLVKQYESQLDSYALGIMALELICTQALSVVPKSGVDDLRGSWRRLLTAWSEFRLELTRLNTEVFNVFSLGMDFRQLRRKFQQERVGDKVLQLVAGLRDCLYACIDRTQEEASRNLLWVVMELLDERSNISLVEAVEAVNCTDMYPLRKATSKQPSIVATSADEAKAPPTAVMHTVA